MSILPKRNKTAGEWFGGAVKGDFGTTKTDWAAVATGVAATTGAATAAIAAAKVAEAVEQTTRAETTAAYQRGRGKK